MPTFPINPTYPTGDGGHTLSEWQEKVAALLRDAAHVDYSGPQITTVGIAPAIAQFSTDRSREIVVEVAGGGTSPYYDLPAGWDPGFSSLTGVEAPARSNPPLVLDSQSWRIVRKPTDVSVFQILLDRNMATSQYVRFTFTARWPMPTNVASDDLINAVAFEAVAALAASKCCLGLVPAAARDRDSSMPSDWSAGQGRTQNLQAAAEMFRAAYDSYLGIGAGGASSDAAPAYGTIDFDPSYYGVWHGGRQ